MWAKFEVEMFNGKGYFLLWRKKMRVVLVQLKVAKAIIITLLLPCLMTRNVGKVEMDEIAMNTIILHLSNSVLRKVDDITTIAKMWEKLE